MSDAPIPIVKESLADQFVPTDTNEKRAMLTQSLNGAKMRWYQLDLERLSREMTMKQASEGKLRATKHREAAVTEIKPQIETRLAQVLSEQQQLENEIKVYSDALKSLPKDE
jgi:hypothetical protein